MTAKTQQEKPVVTLASFFLSSIIFILDVFFVITGLLSYLLAVLNPSNTGFEQFFTLKGGDFEQ